MQELEILEIGLLEEFKKLVGFDPLIQLQEKSEEKLPFDYLEFYQSISSVYSSKIEGEEVDVDSYIKHKFLKVAYEPDYTKRADDLFSAYEYIETNDLTGENVKQAHEHLSKNFLSTNERGKIRNNPMFVMNSDDRIEYIACDQWKVRDEWDKLFSDIKKLRDSKLSTVESFYYGALIHLVFLKIHPMQDGNGRTARLIEKWFLKEKIGKVITSLELEKNYFLKKQKYYDNIRKLGLEYEELDYSNSLDFLLMTVNSLK